MYRKSYFLLALLALGTATGCQDDDGNYEFIPEPTRFTATPFAQNLVKPIGLSVGSRGQLWVSESGTGQNDARISLVTANGQVYPALTGFASVLANGTAEGISHILYDEGTLYVLEGGTGKLYTVDVSTFKPGDPPRTAQSLPSEDIGTFVRAQRLTDPVNTNLYNLTFGPDGHLYIVDSGANAIIKRHSATRALSVFARLPNVTATQEAVPTGIVYDGRKFLVTTLSGGPFTRGTANIYQVDPAGIVSVYKSGFTTLTDITLSVNYQPIVTEYGQFAFSPPPQALCHAAAVSPTPGALRS
ncbi:ScyD/ScyE family protein [Hymenobacter volaticus]|uniref:ScyD/ScyE family protein n=1 Tax=Hymenobacter volaticus TaxID=2932254 RepID=A0ABY4GGL1_9BACT|nr:ScyD/ScyE family protein [Hymenobacter volaticus]UOQ69604.1 ScyD/ScyE family protein [Hymenobacter volaticus]